MNCTPTRYDWSRGYPRPLHPRRIHPRMSRTWRTVLDTVVFGWAVGGVVLAILLMMSGCSGNPFYPGDKPAISLEVLAPVPELAEATELATVDLDKHLGTGSRVDPSGITVTYAVTAQDLEDIEGLCGGTVLKSRRAAEELVSVRILVPEAIPSGCPERSVTIEHEAIHALRAYVTVANPEGPRHAESGLFAPSVAPGDGYLDESSATMACESGYCTTWEL